MNDYYLKNLEELKGREITAIYYNKQNLRFDTKDGPSYNFTVDGDCCSHSEFWDFYGVANLLTPQRVESVETIELDPSEGSRRPDGNDESTQYYGYKITMKDGSTGVFTFRNMSNGYYGGILDDAPDKVVYPEIKGDVIEAEDEK